jgi:hypothetical protein
MIPLVFALALLVWALDGTPPISPQAVAPERLVNVLVAAAAALVIPGVETALLFALHSAGGSRERSSR